MKTLASKADFTIEPPTHEGVAYGPKRRGVAPLADLYLPSDGGPRPGVLLVHGGGFVIGSRRMKATRLLGKHMRTAGFAVASIDYRLLGRGGRIQESLDDVVAAARWWATAGPQEHGVRPGPFSIVGLSAGATLSLMAASEVGSEIVGDVVSVFGLYDFAGVKGPIGAGMRKFVLAGAEDWQARSPVFSKLQVPLTLLHGTVDQMVPVEQAHRLRDAREAEGLPTTFHEYEGARHAFFNSERLAPSEEALGDVLDALRRAARSR